MPERDCPLLLVVVPFLNEAALLPGLLDSLAHQSRAPDLVLLVDDGSTDGSLDVCRPYVEQHANWRLVERPRRPPEADRLMRASVFRAFSEAFASVENWDVAVKLDADLLLPPRHFEVILEFLDEHPQIGIAGAFLSAETPDGLVRETHPASHVRGPNKFYRRACWDAIQPLPPILGWDIIDETTARLRGWQTASVELPGGDPVHRRKTGAHDGRLRAFRRWGVGQYAAGMPALGMLAGAASRARQQPYVLGSAAYLAGWMQAAFRRVHRASPEVRKQFRAEQHARIRRAVTRRA